jgi:hypothetical protein
MKPTLFLAFFILAHGCLTASLAIAQSLKGVRSSHHAPVQSSQTTGGLEMIDPKEDKERKQGDWNGSYFGVNAGAGFGATAGTNVVVPLGSSSPR